MRGALPWLFVVGVGAGESAWAQSEPEQAPIVPSGGAIDGSSTSAPSTAPPARPAPAPSTPAPVARQAVPGLYDRTHARTVDRSGPLGLVGVAFSYSEAFLRADAYVPVPIERAPRLHVGVSTSYFHGRDAIPELAMEAYAVGIYPSAFYDWKIPIASRVGDFVVTAEGGLGESIVRIKLDQPFMPGKFETAHGLGMRFASAGQFRARAGYILSLQLVGLLLPLGKPEAPPQYEVSADASYEIAFMAGYQLQ